MALELEPTSDPSRFEVLVANLTNKIMSVGVIDYAEKKAELKELSVELNGSFDPRAQARDLALVQAMKDRAIEIVSLLTENYLTHKRAVEILTKGWARYSTATSAEKREGEAQLKLAHFIMAANDADIAYRNALGVLRNLESRQEMVSRQISCVQAAAKIMDSRNAFDGCRSGERDSTTDLNPGETDKVLGWEQLEQ